jgi:cytochrome c peroxidase
VTAEADDERVLVNVGKALAAFVERLGTGRTAFDEFRDALARGDRNAAGRYPAAAQRGLRIFVGTGNCSLCHVGPAFTNGEFHDVGVPFLVAPGRVDGGRHEGIKPLGADRFNLLGPYSDDASGAAHTKTRHVDLRHANFGQFKTPRRCGTWPSPRPTCTMGATRACARWSATTRSWTDFASGGSDVRSER